MAGTIIADFIRTDANQLSLNVGNTTFATINAGGFYSNTGVQIISPTGAINAASIAAGSIPVGKLGAASVSRTNMYSGAVLQVIQTTKSDVFTTTSTSYTDVTGLSVSITPTSATSKILVFGTIIISNTGDMAAMQLVRGSTPIQVGIAASNRYAATADFRASADGAVSAAIPLNFLDSPSTTSSTTYKIQVSSRNSGTTRVNAAGDDVDQTNRGRFMSTITVMEIAA